ncbi:MAG: imidazole glycerol phosphate synthase cyclase subunit [Chlorobi bacterium]|nr:imidazole glycerol phosphate synthase cyclase subunit [Chlorobiota bacterium]
MLTRRIIPCLDVKDGRTVKGIRFEGLRDAGDPVDLARRYCDDGADELVLLDIGATIEGRGLFLEIVAKVARAVQIPFTVGGGIGSAGDVLRALHAGADKVSLNSAIVRRPELIEEVTELAGSQAIVAAIDARRSRTGWSVMTRSGSAAGPADAVEWAQEAARRGAGELLVTSIDRDGSGEGYDLQLLQSITGAVSVPVIASGGAGRDVHLRDALTIGGADAVLVAGILHYGRTTIPALKHYLAEQNIPIRP